MRRLALLLALCLAGCTVNTPAPSGLALPAPPGAPVVVTLGDSVPAGTACDCDPFPDLYARRISPDARSVNLAQPGFTSADVRGQVGVAGVRAALRGATVVLIMAGANDLAGAFDNDRDDDAYQASAARVESNVAAVVGTVAQIHGTPVTVLVLGYWNVVKDGAAGLATYGADGLSSAESATHYANQALRQAAGRSGARYVPTTPAFKGDDRDQDPTALLAPDGDHPNAAGHQAIADALYAALPAG
jgi:lysophospholipase L1-like esterase